jgi:pimeloyl-ACP methyl ester carboxylesterase
MIPADETFDGTWPFAPHYFEGRGFKQHYVDEGRSDAGETFVLLHGEPTWGYLWRNFVPRLSQLGRVVVVDHMGFGKSETPQDRSYSTQEHVENLEALLLGIDVQDVTLVGQDWGGALGSQVALRQPDLFKRLVYIDSFLRPVGPPPPDTPIEVMRSWTSWFDLVLDEHFDEVILNLRFTALSVLQRIGFLRSEVVNDTWVRAYSAPFPTAAECKGARQFPLNLFEQATYDYCDANEAIPGALEALKAKPAATFTGAEDRTLVPRVAETALRAYWPDAPFVAIPGVGHYAPEDAPETLVEMIEQFVKTTG